MSENLHDIDKLFRNAIEQQEEMPAGKVWDAVDAGLDKSNVVHIKRKYNNLKKIAAVLLLLLLSVAGYELFKSKTGSADVVTNGQPAGGAIAPAAPEKNTTVRTNEILHDETNNTAAVPDSITRNSGQSAIVNNAGMDNNNDAKGNTNNGKKNGGVADDINSPATTGNTAGNRVNKLGVAPGKEFTVQKNNQPASRNRQDDAYTNSSANRTKAGGVTKIKIKSPRPQQAEDEAAVAGDDIALERSAASAELKPLNNQKTAALASRISKAIAEKEMVTARRSTPDVRIKKQQPGRSYKFSIMPYAAPQLYASTSFKEDKKTGPQTYTPGGPPPPRPGRDNHKEQYKNDEQTQTAFTAGVNAELQLGKKWALQSGVSYTQKTISIEPKKIYARPDKDGKVKYVFDCSSGYSYISSKTGAAPAAGDSITVTSSKNTLGYIGVPVAVSYRISLGKKLSMLPGVGTVLNFLTKQKIKTQLEQGAVKEQQTINKIEGLKPAYVTATAGLALEYDVNKRIAVNIMPSGSFALTSITKDAGVQSFPKAFGVTGGIKIKF